MLFVKRLVTGLALLGLLGLLGAPASASSSSSKVFITLKNGRVYEVKDRISDGSFGIVYGATARGSSEPVVIKFFRTRAHYDLEAAARFGRAYQSQAKNHLVKILDRGVVENVKGDIPAELVELTSVVVMERVTGDLFDLFDRTEVATNTGEILEIETENFVKRVEFVRTLVFQLMNLWAGLASSKLIHGDIKPENLGYLDAPFVVKLIDLGTMRIGPLSSRSGVRLSTTSGYEAPEVSSFLKKQLAPGEFLSSYADLYSIGATLLDLLCAQCSPEEIAKALSAWSEKLNQSNIDSETKLLTLARSNLILEFLKAASENKPKDRYLKLQEGTLGKVFSFQAGKTLMQGYQAMRVRVKVDTPESLDKLYVAAGEAKLSDEAISPNIKKDLAAELLDPAKTEPESDRGLIRRFIGKCGDILRAVLRK